MWPMYVFIICAALVLILIPVGLWMDNYDRKCWGAYKREHVRGHNDRFLRTKAKHSMRMVEATNIIHSLAIVGTLVMFIWMMSTVIWGFLFSIVS